MKKSLCKNNDGFSLVELIIVIAIMAVLVGVVAVQVIPYMEKSREARDISTLDTYLISFTTSIAENEYASDINKKKLSQLPVDVKKSLVTYLDMSSDDVLKDHLSSQKTKGSEVYFTKKASGSGFVLQVEAGNLSVNNYEGASK